MYSALLLVLATTSAAALLVGTSCDSGATCDFLHGHGEVFMPPLLFVVVGLIFDRGAVRRRPAASNALYGLGIAMAIGSLALSAAYVGAH